MVLDLLEHLTFAGECNLQISKAGTHIHYLEAIDDH